MKTPSSASLQKWLKLSAEQAALIRSIGKAANDSEKLRSIINANVPETENYVRQMHSDPYRSQMWRVTVALHAMNEIAGTHGVEALGPNDGGNYAAPYEYLNTGDSYAATLIYNRKSDTLSIGSWGDIVEKHPDWE
jgi:hypothetical protein